MNNLNPINMPDKPANRKRRRESCLDFEASRDAFSLVAADNQPNGKENGMRILLIQHSFRHLKRTLERQGYVLDTGDDPARCGEQARSNELIILDLGTIGSDGLEQLRAWRRSGVKAQVLVLAPRTTIEDKIEALDAGADAFLVKPYHRDELLAQVRALLRRAGHPDKAKMRIFDLELGAGNRVVKRAGRIIKLTRREFELLSLLAAHQGKIVTRAQIWAHLSGQTEGASSNLIDVYIRYLRKKIDAGSDLPLIMTAWGQGYFLRGESELEAAG